LQVVNIQIVKTISISWIEFKNHPAPPGSRTTHLFGQWLKITQKMVDFQPENG